MKFLFALVALSAASLAFAANVIPGLYLEPSSTFLVGYESKEECEASQGDWSVPEWDGDMALCIFRVDNIVKIEGKGSKYAVEISTIGSNGHSCSFEGTGNLMGSTIVAKSSESQECEVNVAFLDADTVNVSTNGECQDFCGARAWLQIDAAKRSQK